PEPAQATAGPAVCGGSIDWARSIGATARRKPARTIPFIARLPPLPRSATELPWSPGGLPPEEPCPTESMALPPSPANVGRSVAQAIDRSDVPLPVLELRPLDPLGPRTQRRPLVGAQRGQPLRDPHVVLELTGGRAADGRAVDRQAQDVAQALLDAEGLQQLRVAEVLHPLDAHPALHRHGQHPFLEAQVQRVGAVT